ASAAGVSSARGSSAWGTLNPMNPYSTSSSGLRMLKKQYGRYAAVGTPRTPEMYAPQVFHGTSTDVTVPESSTARDSTCGARPRLENSPRNMRAGSTSATYWSPATTFSPTPLELTARISEPRRLVLVTIGSRIRCRNP